MEAPQNLLRTKKEYSKNISSDMEFPFKGGSKLLRKFFWCLYRKGVAIHAYLNNFFLMKNAPKLPGNFQAFIWWVPKIRPPKNA